MVGQYLGFGAILAVSVLAAAGLSLLPAEVLAYLGLLPIALGIRSAVQAWKSYGAASLDAASQLPALGVGAIAGTTFANGGDNIGVYVPVFTAVSSSEVLVYTVVFLALVAVWCLAGRYLAGRPLVAKALSRWGHVLLPVVLIAVGAVILLEGRRVRTMSCYRTLVISQPPSSRTGGPPSSCYDATERTPPGS